MGEEILRRTPLNKVHREAGARLVPFAGWEMPVQYTGILEEARAVRTAVGLFDISHMGRVEIEGPGALALLQSVTSNDVGALASGQAQYSLLTNPQGGIIDDIIVYRRSDHRFMVVMNASNTAKDCDWIRSHAKSGVTLEDRTMQTAMIAVQGPGAPALVQAQTGTDVLRMPRFTWTEGDLHGTTAVFCRTGYTGEDGYEVIVPAGSAETVWSALHAGVGVPCGLGARDALRIEAGYPLYGHEIDDTTTPVEAGLMWVVKPEKGDFIGRSAIVKTKDRSPGRRLVGLVLQERIVPRQGYTLLLGDESVGTVTSGVFSPTRSIGLGMAYIAEPHHRAGTTLDLLVRNSRHAATVVAKKDLLSGSGS